MSLLLVVLASLLGISADSVHVFCCRSGLDEHPAEE